MGSGGNGGGGDGEDLLCMTNGCTFPLRLGGLCQGFGKVCIIKITKMLAITDEQNSKPLSSKLLGSAVSSVGERTNLWN